MKNDLWTLCKGHTHTTSIQTEAWRIVEAQHSSATRKLVDTLEEHQILEEMINSAKPPINLTEFTGFDYLHYTPFRYPPLAYGSRFGTRTERSLWYGSLQLSTAMAETAFYRFAFLRASRATFGIVETWLTSFIAEVKTKRGIDLTQKPFFQHAETISAPNAYGTSQQLGMEMRNNKVEAFYYFSARDPKREKNIGVFDPNAFATRQPKIGSFQTWQCFTTATTVEFTRASTQQKEVIKFPIETFLIKNKLPFPAN